MDSGKIQRVLLQYGIPVDFVQTMPDGSFNVTYSDGATNTQMTQATALIATAIANDSPDYNIKAYPYVNVFAKSNAEDATKGYTWFDFYDIDPATQLAGTSFGGRNRSSQVEFGIYLWNGATLGVKKLAIKMGSYSPIVINPDQSATFTLNGLTITNNINVGSWVKTGAYTVANLPSPVTAGVGALCYATNGRKLSELLGLGTGCPVYSDGTSWKTFYNNTVVLA